jgi:2-oxoglutarate dehydrogenase E1 component
MSGSKYTTQIATSSISGGNAVYVEALYERYLEDPASVDDTWRQYFQTLNGVADIPHTPVVTRFEQLAQQPKTLVVKGSGLDAVAAEKQAGVLRLINYYRVRGHQMARLDPLGLAPTPALQDLDPAFHGLTSADLDTVFNTGSLAAADRMPLREIIKVMKTVYTDTIGVEYMYITETQEKRWLQKRLESQPFATKLSLERRREVLLQLTAAEGLERYLHKIGRAHV